MSDAINTDAADFEHPMDNIPVRPLDFEAHKLDTDAVMWSQSCPEFAIFLNAFSVHVPYFERYLIRSMSVAKKHVKDERLLKDMSAIIGQEAHHAKNFIEFNRKMAARYPKIDALEMHAKKDFIDRAKNDDLQTLVGFTAGYETFTFLAGMIILANYEKWMGDSDPVMKAMWVWHQVEEVEHGAVAFEVYKHLYGEKEWYRKYMILKALLHIAWEVMKAYFHMAKHEGFLKNPLRAFKTTWFLGSTFAKMVWYCLPTFSKSYHPRNHPLATTKQNKIAVAWRRFTRKGGDPLSIDRAKMQQIVGFS